MQNHHLISNTNYTTEWCLLFVSMGNEISWKLTKFGETPPGSSPTPTHRMMRLIFVLSMIHIQHVNGEWCILCIGNSYVFNATALSLSVSLPVYLSVCLSVHSSVCLPVPLSVHVFIHLLARLQENISTKFGGIFKIGWKWHKEQLFIRRGVLYPQLDSRIFLKSSWLHCFMFS